MPLRADIADVDAAEWKAQGNQRTYPEAWLQAA